MVFSGPLDYSIVNFSSAATAVVITGVAGKKVRIHGMIASAAGAVGTWWESNALPGGTGGTTMIGPIDSLAAPFLLPLLRDGSYYAEGVAGESLVMEFATGGTNCQGQIYYTMVDA